MFKKSFAPNSWERLEFTSDSTCTHYIKRDSSEVETEVLKYTIEENVIVFSHWNLKGGWMKYGTLLMFCLDPRNLEKEFFGPEFGSGCMIEYTTRKGKILYLHDFPRVNKE